MNEDLVCSSLQAAPVAVCSATYQRLRGARRRPRTVETRAGVPLRELGAISVVTDVESAVPPFEIGIDSVGGATTRSIWHRLEPHGLLIWLGQASRIRPELDYFDWAGAMSVTIRKFNYLDSTHTEAEDLATLVRLVATDRLHPEIGLVATGHGQVTRSRRC
jgi:NADPH:quinone reductase-like Zn-dependent oxidoreductase